MPQNKIALIAAAVAIVVAIAVGAFFVMNKKSPQAPQQTDTRSDTKPQTDESMTKGSIKSLLSMGKNVTCTIKYPMGEQSTEGTVYVSGKNMRGDFSFVSSGKSMDSHVIQDGTYMYSWSSASAQGVKMKMEDVDSVKASPSSQAVDLDKEVDYKCSSWGVDNSKFTPPADIKFVDIGQSMGKMNDAAGSGKPDLSSACDQIPDETAKAQCKQQINNQ